MLSAKIADPPCRDTARPRECRERLSNDGEKR
jgi:hypothetical protein